MIHVCNVHTESCSPVQHERSIVAEGRGIWNPILNIGPYVTIDIDTARGKSSGQRCGGCCVRTRESQGQGAHCTVYSVLYSVHLLGLGCGDMVIATATATSSTQHCSDPGTITWRRHNHHHHTTSWSVTTSSSSLVTVTVYTTKVTAAADPKVVCLKRQVCGDPFVHYGFRWDDGLYSDFAYHSFFIHVVKGFSWLSSVVQYMIFIQPMIKMSPGVTPFV